jgi:hypothetical protein
MALAARTCRRFTLGDAMILIAAMAVGLALNRVLLESVPDGFTRVASVEGFIEAIVLVFPCFMAMTVASLLFRLRGPRPRAASRSSMRWCWWLRRRWGCLAIGAERTDERSSGIPQSSSESREYGVGSRGCEAKGRVIGRNRPAGRDNFHGSDPRCNFVGGRDGCS